MNFGILHESRLNEKRVCLTPRGATSLIKRGHSVFVESGAGVASGFTDQAYTNKGAQIVFSSEEIYGRSDILLKLLPVNEECLDQMLDGQTVLTFQHLSVSSPGVFKSLTEKKITLIGMEIMEEQDGSRPILTIMSELAGQMAPIIAGNYLGRDPMGRGVLLGSVPGVAPASVVIIGAGMVGASAAQAFVGLGAQVHVLDKNIDQLRIVKNRLGERITTLYANQTAVEKMISSADVVVTSILERGAPTPQIITRAMVKKMKHLSVLIDYSIDEGGASETSRPTLISDPVYVDEGVIHYCVPNITSGINRTTSIALSNVLSKYLIQIAEMGIHRAMKDSHVLKKGLYTLEGRNMQPVLNRQFGIKI
ncbi:MAG: alanine dehydrogenase [Candidatus Marinimicrobia bacterium]|jgi:alanine dehydrogenase|nr:alanine dehydrogenase [Candidatus Neomarinimicrobiota bacterium]MBT3631982.1 alanine dehydrogenase [Candidatus Neomarinimicrobiota bacterium]MBT3824568.1 alanine dehydrogenase [Candidatus Neomarinimicrobiota bacterium]MBT4130257.1 alanine dehydrogenase [Candidatus Neomarinimicrobiota bacterium]MBT4297008.1 alanine dehydrogenase [Candidatus Neomarinimicrobiota bacterium]